MERWANVHERAPERAWAGPPLQMNEIELRRAGVDDLPALAELQWRWRVEEWNKEPTLDRRAFGEAFVQWAAPRLDSHAAFVALRDGHAIGMAWIATIDRVPTPDALIRRIGHMQGFYVVPEERDRKVGSALLQMVIEEARRRGYRYVLVHPSERSIPLYRRRGFIASDEFLVLQLPPG